MGNLADREFMGRFTPHNAPAYDVVTLTLRWAKVSNIQEFVVIFLRLILYQGSTDNDCYDVAKLRTVCWQGATVLVVLSRELWQLETALKKLDNKKDFYHITTLTFVEKNFKRPRGPFGPKVVHEFHYLYFAHSI